MPKRRGLDYLEFDLAIREHEQQCVASVRSPTGEGEVEISSFRPEERENINLVIENVFLRSWVAMLRHYRESQIPRLREIGTTLFTRVFSGPVKDHYQACRALAAKEEKGLRLRLRLDRTLAPLPWELLYDPQVPDFLALSVKTPVVRYLEVPQPARKLPALSILRALFVIANPKDERYAPLDVKDEMERISTALANLQNQGLLEVHFLEGPGTLQQLMRWQQEHERHHIFHFIGHGFFDEEAEQGFLIGEDASGLSTLISADDLARIVGDVFDTRLVVLN